METTWNIRPHFNDQMVPHFGNEILTMVPEDTDSHFEYFESGEHADALTDLANSNPYTSAALGIFKGVKGVFGKKGPSADVKAAQQFHDFNASHTLPFYPTKAEMLKAADQGKWERVEPAAIQATYNQNDGTWNRGDWNMKVTSTSPISAIGFKGSGKPWTVTSSVNATVPAGGSPSNAAPTTGGSQQVITTPTGNTTASQIQQGVQQLLAQGASNDQAHSAVADALGIHKDVVKQHAQNAGGGGGGGDSVLGGLSMPIIIGIVAVIGLIIFLAVRK